MTNVIWPLREARHLLAQPRSVTSPMLFEAGFGPSGPPHVGTLAECLRTSWVQRSWETLTGAKADFVVFCDDMDGLRRSPVGMETDLDRFRGLPLCRVPDPSGIHASWGERNLAMLVDMLRDWNVNYRIMRASEAYGSGQFDASMLRVLEEHEQVAAVVRPTLGEALRASWSPFMPLHPVTGRVMSVEVQPVPAEGAVAWTDPANGRRMLTPVTGGQAKLGWKADWGMRWAALGVDWEMNGKDLAENRPLSESICRIIGGSPPLGMTAELLLDVDGSKLSKSRGGGMTAADWVAMGGTESLSMFLMGAPEEARRFHAGLIAPAIDALAQGAERLVALDNISEGTLENGTFITSMQEPAWYALGGVQPASFVSPFRFPTVLAIARVLRNQDLKVVISMLSGPGAGDLPEATQRMAAYAHAMVATESARPRAPTVDEATAMLSLAEALRALDTDVNAETIQSEAYAVGKATYGKAKLRLWFSALYEVLLGGSDGPRFGRLTEIIGKDAMVAALENAALRAESALLP